MRQEPGVGEVELVDGRYGEFTVLVDGNVVAKKRFFMLPSVDKVLAKVREAQPAVAEHR